MSLRIEHDAPLRLDAHGKKQRKLAVARRSSGARALVWLLVGFLLGAGAATAVLMRADFNERAEIKPVRLSLVEPTAQVVPPAPPARPPIAEPAPLASVATALPVKPRAASKPPASTPTPSAAPLEVVEDAVATGMTSRQGARESDLY